MRLNFISFDKPFQLIFSALVILFLPFLAHAQVFNLEFEDYNTTDGLSQNHVSAIVQDKNGFMWFGTDDGLSRFDGHDFKIYKYQENNPNSLVDNSIRALFIDEKGAIWIGTNKGICKFYPETETFEQFEIDYIDITKVSGSQVSSIKKDKYGSIWISYIGDGVDVIVPNQEEVLHYTINRSDKLKLKNDLVSSLLFMPNGDKLLGTLSGIEVIDKKGLVLNDSQVIARYPWAKRVDNSVKCLLLSKSEDILWIGTELQGLYKIDLRTNSIKNFNKENSKIDFNHILTLKEDSKGNLWVGSEALYLFDKKTETLVLYNEYGIQGNLVIKNPVYSIFEDKDKNIWLGTVRLGVLKYNPDQTNILHYHTNQGEGSIKSNEVLSFNQDAHGQVWVGTGGAGLYKLREDFKGFDEAEFNSKFKSLVIKCIYKDSAGYFWMGTWDSGMLKYHPIKKTLDLFHPDKGNFGSRHVWDIKEDKKGNFWIATLRDGLCYFSPKTNKYKYFRNIPTDSGSLVNDDIMSVFLDSKEVLWVGSANGLSVLKPGSEKFLNVQETTPENPLSANLIYSIYEDYKGRIWLATNGGGITIMNRDLKVIKVLKEEDGLPSNTVTSILNDTKGYVWISTYKGLAKINLMDFSIVEAPQITGLQEKEYLPNSSFRGSDGKLFFGGVNGFHLFHPDSLEINSSQTRLLFTSLKIFNDEIVPNSSYKGRKILEKSITEVDELNLSYEDYSFTITFAPITYNWQKSMKYAYFLENLDKDWQFTNHERRFLHYTNLSPGEYTLKVKYSFDGKTWPQEAKVLKIYISPPFWATIWFKIALLIFVVLILLVIYQIRVKFLKKQSRRLEKLVVLRTSELQKSNEEIQKLLEEVDLQKKSIEHQNFELQQINTQLGEQRDALAYKSKELEKAQHTLQEINASLEQLVNKRTEKLNDTVRELETFLYRASHDLRGPIMSMLGLIRLGQIENSNEGHHKSYYDYLLKSVVKLERTLQKLLEKHTILKLQVTRKCFSKKLLEELLQDIIKDVRSFRKDDFEVIIPEEIEFKTDKTLLCILIINLLENAFLFSERAENKKVVLEFNVVEGRTIITVRDFGIGIRQEIQDRIFTMFYRGSELSNGNGLGLYLVKSALDKLDGSIVLESEEGTFSCFKVTL